MFTIVIPVYNTPIDYIKQCINSVVNQNCNILILDDGSKEVSTKAYLQGITHKVIHLEHQGLSSTMNYATSISPDKWFLKLDSDDIAQPNWVETMEKAIEKYPGAAAIGCQLDCFGSLSGLRTTHPEKVTIEWALQDQECWLMNHTGCALRTEAIKNVPYRENRKNLVEDYELWINLLIEGYELVNIPECLIKYRTSRTPRQANDKKEFNKEFIKFLRGKLENHLSK